MLFNGKYFFILLKIIVKRAFIIKITENGRMKRRYICEFYMSINIYTHNNSKLKVNMNSKFLDINLKNK